MAELGGIAEMEKALGDDVMMRSSAEQTGPAEEPEAQTEEFTRKFFLKTSGGAMVDLLDTNPLVMAAHAEMSGYSITPKTFQSRTFFGEAEPSGGQEKESHAGSGSSDARADGGLIHPPRGLTYIDEFAFGTNTVTRFGINSELPEIKDILAKDGIELYSMDDAATTVTRKSAKYNLIDAKHIKLSTIEIALLNMSIEELRSGKKVVVLDIFERQNGGEKNGCVNTKDEKIKTHSVVLYKNPIQSASTEMPEILVIDPSNFLFSSHLSNYQHSSGIVIKTCHTGLQVYKSPTGSEGPDHSQYRDCIDVAVKIALGLNASNYGFNCTSKQTMSDSIKECSTILNLSNVGALDKTMETLGSGPARVKQTSDQTLWDIFYTARKTIKQNLDVLDTLDEQDMYSEQLDAIRSSCISVIEVPNPPKKIVQSFVHKNDSCVELFSQIPAKYQEHLLGSIGSDMEEAVDCCWGC